MLRSQFTGFSDRQSPFTVNKTMQSQFTVNCLFTDHEQLKMSITNHKELKMPITCHENKYIYCGLEERGFCELVNVGPSRVVNALNSNDEYVTIYNFSITYVHLDSVMVFHCIPWKSICRNNASKDESVLPKLSDSTHSCTILCTASVSRNREYALL